MSDNYEIERKFLISDPNITITEQWPCIKMLACYTKWDKDECERVRIESTGEETECIFTYKKTVTNTKRIENERHITLFEAIQMIKQSPNSIMVKDRLIIPYEHNENLYWEVDVFSGDNDGLLVAEIEFPSEDIELILPDWIGQEVTDDMRYTNVQLNLNPFNTWK